MGRYYKMSMNNKANGGNVWIPGAEGKTFSQKSAPFGDTPMGITIIITAILLFILGIGSVLGDLSHAKLEERIKSISEPSQIISKSEIDNSFILEIGDEDTNSSKTEKVTVSEDVYKQLDVGEYYKKETSTK
jgi:hypothetical protein